MFFVYLRSFPYGFSLIVNGDNIRFHNNFHIYARIEKVYINGNNFSFFTFQKCPVDSSSLLNCFEMIEMILFSTKDLLIN